MEGFGIIYIPLDSNWQSFPMFDYEVTLPLVTVSKKLICVWY
uniref:Uncharacterized protein n=1 Tax=Rhizophora mucronata TaxID=61149 RepID=A0A2P2P7V9_RHIMU